MRGSARATESSIVASEIDHDVSAVPISFSLGFDPADIDSSVTYTLQATIVDGTNAWVTGKGVPVLTKGNPSDVDITLAYRPDLLKGAVSGQISAVGVHPSTSAYAMAVVVDPATGDSLGMDVQTVANGLPQAFAVPYTITDVDPANDYVVTAEVVRQRSVVAERRRRPGHDQGQSEDGGPGRGHPGRLRQPEPDRDPRSEREPRNRPGATAATCSGSSS